MFPHALFTTLLKPVDTFSQFDLTGPQSLVLCFCIHQVAITRDAASSHSVVKLLSLEVVGFPDLSALYSELVTIGLPSSVQPLLANQ